jgi:ATP-dependent protease HslVU (ClpYQ) peptidase subunit
MFQIKSEHDQLAEKKSISTPIYKQFLKYQGLSEDIHIAELEQELINEGKFEEFKKKIKEIKGKDWEEVRKSKIFSKKPIGRSLFEISPSEFKSEDEALKAFEALEKKIELSVSMLTDKIVEYIKQLEKSKSEFSPHIVFVIDEMGQYIGDSNDLLLELQSIVEQFGIKGRGKIWILITSQERLDEIIEGVKGMASDYAKIMDRFDTKLHLTSENIVRVLEERILKKKEQANPKLSEIYSKYAGVISYASKMEGSNRPIVECYEDNFNSAYPFLPYQLEITQQIFANIRKEAGHARRITGTERTMLGVAQSVIKSPTTRIKDSPLGRVVTFYEIFDQIITEIPPDTLRDINNVQIKLKEDPEVVKNTLKTLYLLQQIEWIPKTHKNIAKAMISEVETNTAEFEVLVKSALQELVKARYVISENDQYEYISGSKKQIEDEISREPVKKHEEKKFAKELLKGIITIGRVNYEGIKHFDVKVYGDDEEFTAPGEIILRVYSPLYVEYGELEKDQILSESFKNPDTVYWLPDPEISISTDISKYLRTKNVLERREKNVQKSAEEIAILREKNQALITLKENIEKTLKKALLSGIIINDGNEESLDGKGEIKTVMEREIGRVIPFIYPRFSDAKVKVNEKSIKEILTCSTQDLYQLEKELDLFDEKGNIKLHGKVVSEVFLKIRQACDKGEILTGSELMKVFELKPYGWDPTLVRIVTTALFRSGSIYLKFDGRDYIDYKKPEAAELLTNYPKFKKTVLCYEEEEAIPLSERKEIQKYLNIIFNVKSDDTVNSLSQNIEEQLTKIKSSFEKQEIYWEQNGIKLKDIFYDIEELCQRVLGQARMTKKLKEFLSNADKVKQAYEYQNKIQKFIDSDESKLLPRVKTIPPSISISSIEIDKSDYETHVGEINAIITKKEIIEKWPAILQNYSKALERYKEIYENLHEKRYEIYSKMKEEITLDPQFKSYIKTDTFDPIKTYLCKETKWESSALRCSACNFNLSELDNHILSATQKKEMILVKLIAREKEKQITLNLKAACKKTIIRNEDDLEEAVGNIKQKVKSHLEKSEIVILQ